MARSSEPSRPSNDTRLRHSMSEEEEEEAWTKKEVERWFWGGGPRVSSADPQDDGLTAADARELVKKAYREANPSKVARGEVDELIARYEGQEWLLLRRVQHRYGLVAVECDASSRLEVAAGPGASWRRGTAKLDARTGTVETFLAAPQKGEPRVFTADATSWHGRATDRGRIVAVGPDLALRFADEREAMQWRRELGRTGAFFGRLRFEARSKAREERDKAAAVTASLRDAEAHKRSPQVLLAGVEAALDDALLAATLAADADEAWASGTAEADDDSPERVFEKYLEAVAALARAKAAATEAASNAAVHLDHDVLAFVDDGATRCRARAEELFKDAARDASERLRSVARARAVRAKMRDYDASARGSSRQQPAWRPADDLDDSVGGGASATPPRPGDDRLRRGSAASTLSGTTPGGGGHEAAAPFLLVTGNAAHAYVAGDDPSAMNPEGAGTAAGLGGHADDDFVFDDEL